MYSTRPAKSWRKICVWPSILCHSFTTSAQHDEIWDFLPLPRHQDYSENIKYGISFPSPRHLDDSENVKYGISFPSPSSPRHPDYSEKYTIWIFFPLPCNQDYKEEKKIWNFLLSPVFQIIKKNIIMEFPSPQTLSGL